MTDKENINNEDMQEIAETEISKDEVKSSKKKSKSFMDTVREVNERERLEELERQAKMAEKIAEKERTEREAYAKKLRDEHVELMKLKSGVITEDEVEKPEEEPPKVYTFKQKFSNFIYHYKWTVLVSTFILVLVGMFIYDMATQVNPDVRVMVLATDPEFTFLTEKMAEVFEQYCDDYNDDGKVNVRVSYLRAVVDENDPQDLYVTQADQTKLVAEFQSIDSIIVIADLEACEHTKIGQGVLADMRLVFPGDENATYLGYMLNGTNFAEDIGYPELADNLFIGFREPISATGVNDKKFQKNYDDAIDMWKNYVNNNVINPTQSDEEAQNN